MWKAIGTSYATGWRFAVAFPLLFLIPVATEFVQHLIELHIGMFDGVAQAEATDHHPMRIGFGYVKLAALLVVGLWVTRYLAGRDGRLATALDGRRVAAFVPVILVALAWTGLQDIIGLWTPAAVVGKAAATAIGLGLFAIGTLLQVLWAGWRCGVPLGDPRMTFWASHGLGGRILLWGLGLYLAVFVPPLVVHTALNVGMVFAGRGPLLWALFVVDSLLVGAIAGMLWASFYFIYLKALDRAGLRRLASASD